MNLVTEPWIPVVTPDGTVCLASLLDTFTKGRQFADLAVRPHERIALMRLLICIAQAALNGPDINDWEEAPGNLPKAAKCYLDKWCESFDLFHPQTPFLQVANLEKPPKPEKKNTKSVEEKGTEEDSTLISISKLDFALASGNNTTLFDHYGTPEVKRQILPAAAALQLLTFQCFSPGGTIGVAFWNQRPTLGWKSYPKVKPGQSNHAPCLPKNMLHAFIRQSTLFDTLCANLLTKETVAQHFIGNKPWGKPIWESFPTGPDDSEAISNATETYLGRLVPLTRCIRLNRNGRELLLANGLEYPGFENKKRPFSAEPSATVILKRDQTERMLLGASTGKAIWRELSALIISRKQAATGGPLTLTNVPENAEFDLWVGALITNKANVLDTMESVLHIPANMRTDNGRASYDAEVRWAESIARRLAWAVETYREQADGGWEARVKMAGPNKNQLRRQLHATATRHYWTAVEKLRPLLMEHVGAINTSEFEPKKEQWHKAIHGAARDAYQLACGQETPRQMRAFALGWSKLFAKPKDQPENSDESETDKTEV